MFVSSTASAPVRERNGLTSRILLQADDTPDTDLAVTWVDINAGASQAPHKHDPQQVYVIISGTGRMHVGDEQRQVGPGDLIFIPPQVVHGITNTGEEPLTYVSAATPTFSITDIYDTGQLSRPA